MRAVWLRTEQNDTCGNWQGMRALAVQSRLGMVKDQEVIDLVREMTVNMVYQHASMYPQFKGVPMVRSRKEIVTQMEEKGYAESTVLDRIRSLYRRKLLGMGRAPDPYRLEEDWKLYWGGMCVWIPGSNGSPVDAMPSQKGRVIPKTADLDPRWELVREVMQEPDGCPDQAHALSLRQLLERVQLEIPTINHSALHRYLRRRIEDGTVGHGPAGYFVKAPTQPIEVD
jgi:hypothetical protein